MEKKLNIFIGSSSAGLPVANAFRDALLTEGYTGGCTVWVDAFEPSGTTLRSLMEMLDAKDYAVFICTFDDLLTIRRKGEAGGALPEMKAIRDNVTFELGLFMGRHGQERAFGVIPRSALGDSNQYHIPSDFKELTFVPYDETVTNLHEALKDCAKKIKARIEAIEKESAFVDLSGKWLHIHDKQEMRVGRVEITQEGSIITKASGLNVKPAGTDYRDYVTKWKYNQGMVQQDSDGTATMVAIYDANSSDEYTHNDGLHVMEIHRDKKGNADFMKGTFTDIYNRAKDRSVDEHTGNLMMFKMSPQIEAFLEENVYHEEEALSELYLQPEFAREPFVKELKSLLKKRGKA